VLPAQQQSTTATVPLANVFYYGKEFGTKPQKVGRQGLVQEDYRPLSVVQPGAELPQPKEEDEVDSLFQQQKKELSIEDLINMLRGD